MTMKEMLKSILKREGFDLVDVGNWLVARKGNVRINMGFLTGGKIDLDEINELEGKKVIVPMDDLSYDETKDVTVLDRKKLYEDFTRVLFGEEDFTSSIFYQLIGAEDSWEDVKVERFGDHEEEIIKPVMTFDDVVELSKKTVGGFRYVLELVPHFIFQYSYELRGEEGSLENSGLISVNALTKKCEIWRRNFETVSMLDHETKKIEPRLGEAEASELARMHAVDKSTMVVEDVTEKEHTVVIEKKRVGPEANEMSVKLEGLYYLPIWCVEGTNGVMIVNAAAGKIIEEDYYVR
jgi:hypothetical protein